MRHQLTSKEVKICQNSYQLNKTTPWKHTYQPFLHIQQRKSTNPSSFCIKQGILSPNAFTFLGKFLMMFDGTQLALERKFPCSNSEKDRIPQMDSF